MLAHAKPYYARCLNHSLSLDEYPTTYSPAVKVTGSHIGTSTNLLHATMPIEHRFSILFARRRFVHWYIGEGLEESEISEAREAYHCWEKDMDWGDHGHRMMPAFDDLGEGEE